MEKYISQLIEDIKAAKYTEPANRPLDDTASFEDYIFEVERYLNDRPSVTLGEYTQLHTTQFPSEKRLTSEQCDRVIQALNRTFFTYGINLEIPEGLPIRIVYKHFVEALEKPVFISTHGQTTFNYCHYDFDGHCPFGVSKCPCYKEWEEETNAKRERPEEDWYEIDAIDIYWYDLLQEIEAIKPIFEQASTPNKTQLKKLFDQLIRAFNNHKTLDAMTWYAPKPEDIPPGDYQPYLECLEVGKVVFPDRNQLVDLELQFIALALNLLFGKGFTVIAIRNWSIEKQYDQLSAHFSRWAKRIDGVDCPLIYMKPQKQTIFDIIRAEKPKYRSEWDEFNAAEDAKEAARAKDGTSPSSFIPDSDDLPF